VTPAPKRRGKPLPKAAGWRCIVMGEAEKVVAEGGVLYGALNHAAGVGWVARVGLSSGGASARQAFIYIHIFMSL